jgi:hypothetical protein
MDALALAEGAGKADKSRSGVALESPSGVTPRAGRRAEGAQESLWSRVQATNFGHLDVDC